MIDSEFLLYPVFEKLRRMGVPLGVSEYIEAIKLMRTGSGESLEDVDGLKRLCRLLWAKSREDQELFDEIFLNEIEIRLKASPHQEGGGAEVRPQDTSKFDLDETQNEKSEQQNDFGQSHKPETRQEEQTEQHLSTLPSPRSLSLENSLVDEPDGVPRKFLLTPLLPINRRDTIGIWRQLRKLRREGPPEELDVQGTIDSICRSGFFLRPVLQPRRRNQASLVLLLDQQRSMEPFSLLIELLVESVLRSGLHGQTKIFYFHDCPEMYLFEKPQLVGAKHIDEILADHCKGNSVLIISDAGAARGNYDRSRLDCTKEFLKALSEFTYLYAWLNPMPVDRWVDTTADGIRFLVPMYPLNRDGMNDVVNILRGHPFPSEIRLNA